MAQATGGSSGSPESIAMAGLLPSVHGDSKTKKQTDKADAKSDNAASSDRRPTRKATDPQWSPTTLPEIVVNSAQSPAREKAESPANSICSENSMCDSELSWNGRKQHVSVNQHRERDEQLEEDVKASLIDDADLPAELPWSNDRPTESTTTMDVMNDDSSRYSSGRQASKRSGTQGISDHFPRSAPAS